MSTTSPRFSIVIPCFNQGPFLAEALHSVFEQRYPASEIIVVDDGSTDPHSVHRIDELCVPPVRKIRQVNKGLSAARNAGIAVASGDWIVPLDSDDKFAPEALAYYAHAIGVHPEVDIWYPDLLHFGLDDSEWRCHNFNAWLQLHNNGLIYASAIRRAVFDAGVVYNENMRRGYEDWEFFIHACCERDFRPRALQRSVFRYRRWGFSMLSATTERAGEVIAQLRSERKALFGDANRLDAIKREWAPALAIAVGSPRVAAAMTQQTCTDFRVVDETGAALQRDDLDVFAGHLGRWLLVGFDDNTLAEALAIDPFLVEKTLRMLEANDPAVVRLVAWRDAERAYPGELIAADLGEKTVTVGMITSLAWLLSRRNAEERLGTLLEDLWQAAVSRATWTIGAAGPKTVSAPVARRGGPRKGALAGLLPPDRGAAHAIAHQPTRYASLDSDGDGLLIFVPWIIAGGADVAIRDLVVGLAARDPRLRIYLVVTQPLEQQWGPQVWATTLLPCLCGWFSLPALGPDMSQTVAALCERLRIRSVLVMNSGAGLDAIPAIRRESRPVRIVSLLHAFGVDQETGERIGWPRYAASRYNNVIDDYVVTSSTLKDILVREFYVSPTKLHVIPATCDMRRHAAGRAPRFANGRTTVLWLGRLSAEKNPFTLVDVAAEWHSRHPKRPIKFVVAGSGVLESEMRRRIAARQMGTHVSLIGEVSDVPALMRDADLLMMTSLSEGVPLVLFEALAAELPFVTSTRNTSIRDFFTAEHGYFIEEATDATEYVNVLEHMLDNPAEARDKAARNRERSDELDVSRTVEQMHRLLFSVPR